MGKLKDNLMMDTVAGKVGKQVVFRDFRGQTIVAGRPKPGVRVFQPTQVKAQRRFRAASAYAKHVLADAELKVLYEGTVVGTKSTAREAAIKDYLTPPIVEEIELSRYKGAVNDVITILAIDDVKVTKVEVTITSAAGVQLEAGLAVKDKFDDTKWRYTATVANALLAGTIVSATAFDVPENQGVLTKAL